MIVERPAVFANDLFRTLSSSHPIETYNNSVYVVIQAVIGTLFYAYKISFEHSMKRAHWICHFQEM